MSYNNDAIFNALMVKLEAINFDINGLNNQIFLKISFLSQRYSFPFG